MDHKTEVREFLSSRRARLNPQDAGLPAWGGNRRVPGLRREEVAMLAGVSVDYYTRLERGNLRGVSDEVLLALAEALQLDDAERSHLSYLAQHANAGSLQRVRAKRPPAAVVRPEVARIIESMDRAAGFVVNDRRDVLAANPLGRALFDPLYGAERADPPNLARFTFLEPAARTFFGDWDKAASTLVGNLRTAAGRNPYDKTLTDLIGELSTRSEEFAILWAAHDVRFHRTGLKTFNHPDVGELDLSYEAMPLPADPGLTLIVYTAVQSSPSAERLVLLASWAQTRAREAAELATEADIEN